ncbi:hypothetical protein CL634_08720 [bacterium]|nr:hypothetical protein [bacterium]|tara:strand:+ start:1259 stop:1441 length:183 start_codon:yes stop_codon:yes gene_type:complete
MKQCTVTNEIDTLIERVLQIDLVGENLSQDKFEEAVISANKAVVTLEELQETISNKNINK